RQDGKVERLLRAVVVVPRRDVDAPAPGDVADLRAVEPPFGEEAAGGSQQAVLRGGLHERTLKTVVSQTQVSRHGRRARRARQRGSSFRGVDVASAVWSR